jgi:hypothetical protein
MKAVLSLADGGGVHRAAMCAPVICALKAAIPNGLVLSELEPKLKR